MATQRFDNTFNYKQIIILYSICTLVIALSLYKIWYAVDQTSLRNGAILFSILLFIVVVIIGIWQECMHAKHTYFIANDRLYIHEKPLFHPSVDLSIPLNTIDDVKWAFNGNYFGKRICIVINHENYIIAATTKKKELYKALCQAIGKRNDR